MSITRRTFLLVTRIGNFASFSAKNGCRSHGQDTCPIPIDLAHEGV
jgi:hypothetical protein